MTRVSRRTPPGPAAFGSESPRSVGRRTPPGPAALVSGRPRSRDLRGPLSDMVAAMRAPERASAAHQSCSERGGSGSGWTSAGGGGGTWRRPGSARDTPWCRYRSPRVAQARPLTRAHFGRRPAAKAAAAAQEARWMGLSDSEAMQGPSARCEVAPAKRLGSSNGPRSVAAQERKLSRLKDRRLSQKRHPSLRRSECAWPAVRHNLAGAAGRRRGTKLIQCSAPGVGPAVCTLGIPSLRCVWGSADAPARGRPRVVSADVGAAAAGDGGSASAPASRVFVHSPGPGAQKCVEGGSWCLARAANR